MRVFLSTFRRRNWLALFAFSLAVAHPAAATNCYVSFSGSDTNAGTSPASAWRSIARVNRATVLPGDGIFFDGGFIYSGSLLFDEPRGGTAANPVTVSSYGIGRATITPEANDPAIRIRNTAGIRVMNLILAGSGRTANTSDGIYASTDLANNVKLALLDMRNLDINGFGHSGILSARGTGRAGSPTSGSST